MIYPIDAVRKTEMPSIAFEYRHDPSRKHE